MLEHMYTHTGTFKCVKINIVLKNLTKAMFRIQSSSRINDSAIWKRFWSGVITHLIIQ